MGELISIKEIAALTERSVATVYRWKQCPGFPLRANSIGAQKFERHKVLVFLRKEGILGQIK